jgi:exodeoxyribonuclease V alpha subunit
MPSKIKSEKTITGIVKRFLYFKEEVAYCVALVDVPDREDLVTVQGTLPRVQCGETLELFGHWIRHDRYGHQFKIARFNSKLPASVQGIRTYLGSGIFPGIGTATANKVVDHFGADTIRIISEEPGRLQEAPHIGKRSAELIATAWTAKFAVNDAMIFLHSCGVTLSQCVRIVEKYGGDAKRIVQDNPYRLVEDIKDISFKTADKIALKLRFPTNSKERIDAGVLHTMRKLEVDGHTLGTESMILEQATKLLSLEPTIIRQRIHALEEAECLYGIQAYDQNQESLGSAYQIPNTAKAERRIAEAIARIGQTASILRDIKIDAFVVKWEKVRGFKLGDQQITAVRNALAAKVSVITGGPGTGKTTILRVVVDFLNAMYADICLASPTGRAAKQLADATFAPASTIHRLLEYNHSRKKFSYNEHSHLNCDFLILDETSMLDTWLAADLFQAIPSGAHVLLVGDADQLPSVRAGSILGDIMAAPPAKVTRLDTIYRQGKESGIVTIAHSILRGETDPGETVRSHHDLDPSKDLDFTFIEAEDPEYCVQVINYLAKEYIPKVHGIDPMKDLQVMSPMHNGKGGITHLNKELQEVLNPKAEAKSRLASSYGIEPIDIEPGNYEPAEIEYSDITYRHGDKVIQKSNDYDKLVFNGETGFIKAIAKDSSCLTIDFGQVVEYAKDELSEVQHAYAISVHKSQGSEYPIVILLLIKQHSFMLQRNLLYTGISRAKCKVYVVGSRDAYAMAVENNKQQVRRTHLQTCLRKAIGRASNR